MNMSMLLFIDTNKGRAHVFNGVVAGHRLVLHGSSDLLVLLGDQQLTLGQ